MLTHHLFSRLHYVYKNEVGRERIPSFCVDVIFTDIRLKSENFLDHVSLRRKGYPPGVGGSSDGKADLGPVRKVKTDLG